MTINKTNKLFGFFKYQGDMVGPRHGWRKIETLVPKRTYSFEWREVEKWREMVKVILELE